MQMTLRFEIFPADLPAAVDFYTRVLRFTRVAGQDTEWGGYVALSRGTVRIGIGRRPGPEDRTGRRPPTGVQLVLEVDDVRAERELVVAENWPSEEDLADRPWGLTDFRILDPAGYYLRITSRD